MNTDTSDSKPIIPTPLTDEATRSFEVMGGAWGGSESEYFVPRELSEQLEKNLAQARESIVELAIAAEFTAEMAGFDRLPEPNCACHLCGPCADCTENGGGREAMKALNDARSKPVVQEALAEWRKRATA